MSVCACAASASGYVAPTTARNSPRAARAKRSASGPATISGRPTRCISQKPTTAAERRISRPVATVFGSPEALP